MAHENTRGWLALLTGSVFFIVAAVLIVMAGLGGADIEAVKSVLALWGSTAGTLTGTVFGFYFGVSPASSDHTSKREPNA